MTSAMQNVTRDNLRTVLLILLLRQQAIFQSANSSKEKSLESVNRLITIVVQRLARMLPQ